MNWRRFLDPLLWSRIAVRAIGLFAFVLLIGIIWGPPFILARAIRSAPVSNTDRIGTFVSYGWRARPALRWLLSAEHGPFRHDFRRLLYEKIDDPTVRAFVSPLVNELPNLVYLDSHMKTESEGLDLGKILSAFPYPNEVGYQDALAVWFSQDEHDRAIPLLKMIADGGMKAIKSEPLALMLRSAKSFYRQILSAREYEVAITEFGSSSDEVPLSSFYNLLLKLDNIPTLKAAGRRSIHRHGFVMALKIQQPGTNLQRCFPTSALMNYFSLFSVRMKMPQCGPRPWMACVC